MNGPEISKLVTTTKVLGDHSKKEFMIMMNDQQSLQQQYTTLRKDSYNTKVTRLEMLREFEEKKTALGLFDIEKTANKFNQYNVSQIFKVQLTNKK